MARTSFLERVQPNRPRSKLIDWPFEVDGEKPRVRVKVLGQDALEAAYLATTDHFKGLKRKQAVTPDDQAFVQREHAELVWRAYEDADGNPLAESADDLVKQPGEVLDTLYVEWGQFQKEVAVRPLKQSELDELVDGLKKNTHSDLLPALPSIWLRQLITTLVSQPASSIQESSPG